MSEPNESETPKSVNQENFWHEDTIITELTGHVDYLILDDCYAGLLIFGAEGSGKTTNLSKIIVDLKSNNNQSHE